MELVILGYNILHGTWFILDSFNEREKETGSVLDNDISVYDVFE